VLGVVGGILSVVIDGSRGGFGRVVPVPAEVTLASGEPALPARPLAAAVPVPEAISEVAMSGMSQRYSPGLL